MKWEKREKEYKRVPFLSTVRPPTMVGLSHPAVPGSYSYTQGNVWMEVHVCACICACVYVCPCAHKLWGRRLLHGPGL